MTAPAPVDTSTKPRRYNRRRFNPATDPIIELANRIQNRIAAEDADGFGWS